jgi:hypothetical protein
MAASMVWRLGQRRPAPSRADDIGPSSAIRLVGRPRVVERAQRGARKNLEHRLLCVLLDDHASEVHRLDLGLRVSEEPGEALVSRKLTARRRQVVVSFCCPMASHKEGKGCHVAISGGALHNLSGDTITLCEGLGLRYWQRIIGLLATIRDSELVMRPSFWQMLHARRTSALGERTHIVAHEDVLVFRKPHPAVAKPLIVRKAA